MPSGIMDLTPEVAGSDVPEGVLNILGLKGKQTTQRMTAWLKRQTPWVAAATTAAWLIWQAL